MAEFQVLELSSEEEIYLSTEIDVCWFTKRLTRCFIFTLLIFQQYKGLELNANLKINDPRMPPKVFMEILNRNVTSNIALLGVLSNVALYER